jgi:hypothetical protein
MPSASALKVPVLSMVFSLLSRGGFVAAGRLHTLQPPFHCYEKTGKNAARNLAKCAGYSDGSN